MSANEGSWWLLAAGCWLKVASTLLRLRAAERGLMAAGRGVRGCLAVWLFGCLAAWLCGCMAVWLWLRGCVAAWLRGCVAVAAWLRGCETIMPNLAIDLESSLSLIGQRHCPVQVADNAVEEAAENGRCRL
jgi:hypothetical protein